MLVMLASGPIARLRFIVGPLDRRPNLVLTIKPPDKILQARQERWEGLDPPPHKSFAGLLVRVSH